MNVGAASRMMGAGMRRWGKRTAVMAAVLAAGVLGGCGARSQATDGGDGDARSDAVVRAGYSLLSDFEDPAGATVVRLEGRNGDWYAYNDGARGCSQSPAPGELYLPSAPPTPSPGPSPTMGGNALHAVWSGCTMRGAGVGADINVPIPDGGGWSGSYTGPRVPYDVSPWGGVTFWAMATSGTDGLLRFKMVMRSSTSTQAGGTCDEAVVGAGKCGDEHSEVFALPKYGVWKMVTIQFTDVGFAQEGWGAPFPWNPREVVGIQVQSIDADTGYDFWIDDVYLTP
jgi:hypothetical protein